MFCFQIPTCPPCTKGKTVTIVDGLDAGGQEAGKVGWLQCMGGDIY
jgi:hypothetical protein